MNCKKEKTMPEASRLVSSSSGDLRPESIAAFLESPIELFWKESTGTTNDDAKQAARTGVAQAVFTAEEQTMGRGRAGRHWISGRGAAVELSLLLHPDIAGAAAAQLSLAAALGVSDAVRGMTGLVPRVKWPNDVLLSGKKICGILCETAFEGGRLAYAVLGIGVNVNQESFEAPISQTATSLRIESGAKLDRAQFAAALIDGVRARVDQLQKGGLRTLMQDYEESSSVLGRCVDVTTRDGIVTGMCEGFGPDGELLVQTAAGLERFVANDVSVRERPDV